MGGVTIMSIDQEHYYAVQSYLKDEELHRIWNIIETAFSREGVDVSNAELSMRLYDDDLLENKEHEMDG